MTSWHSITTAIGLALSGEKVRARRDLITCWEATNEQDHDLTPIGIPQARGLAPSLHLNLADGYLRQGRIDDAASQLTAGLAAEDALDNDGHGALIRKGLSGLADRIAQAQHSTSTRTPT
jgi:hypothetical protein